MDYPPAEDEDYADKVIIPLAMGMGVACFYAMQEGDLAGVAARYNPNAAEAIDPDWRTRVRDAVRNQHEAREIAATMGFEAVVE